MQAREEKLSTFCEFEEIAVFSLIIRLHCSPAAAEGALIISNYPLTLLHRTLTHPPAYKGHHLCGVEGPHPSIWVDLPFITLSDGGPLPNYKGLILSSTTSVELPCML